jgi:hypothetical protein
VTRLRDACGHAGLRLGAPRARVVRALVTQAAVDGQDPVVVREHVPGRGARERVLRLGVEVTLTTPVRDRRSQVLGRRAARAVEHVLEARARVCARERLLPCGQDLRAQSNTVRRVQTVDVAERRREQIASALAGVERLRHPQEILRRRVQPVAGCLVAADAVLLAADDAALDLEHDIQLATLLQQLRGEAQVLLQPERRAVEHVRVKQRLPAARDPLAGRRQQWSQELVDVLRRAVIGVQGDGNRKPARELTAKRGERPSPDRRVARRAGEIARAADGDLHDPVRARVGEAAQRGVQRLRRRDVDRRERVTAHRSAVDHLRVLLGRCKHRCRDPDAGAQHAPPGRARSETRHASATAGAPMGGWRDVADTALAFLKRFS